MSKFDFKSVLFICVANSGRSQMAEGLAREIFGDEVRVQSAGSSPSKVDSLAIQAMAEINIDIAGHSSKSVQDIDRTGIDLVVTLCAEESCPALLSSAARLHWPLQDPARTDAPPSEEEQLEPYRRARDQLHMRLEVLSALRNIPTSPTAQEFHASIRVPSLPEAARFYSWLLGVAPKEWTHRYVTFVSEVLRTNFVIVVSDDKQLHQDTLYHLGIDVGSRQAVVDAHEQAKAAGWTIHKPARTTWRGTPLHELWLKDPGENLVEIYARLTDGELAEMPSDRSRSS
jgi:arsenate reductase